MGKLCAMSLHPQRCQHLGQYSVGRYDDWNVTPCSSVVHSHFGGKYLFHFHDTKICQAGSITDDSTLRIHS
jgi:hypothetical protein